MIKVRETILIEAVTGLILVAFTYKALNLSLDEILDQSRQFQPLSLQEDVPDDVQTGPEDLPDVVKPEVDIFVLKRKEDFPE